MKTSSTFLPVGVFRRIGRRFLISKSKDTMKVEVIDPYKEHCYAIQKEGATSWDLYLRGRSRGEVTTSGTDFPPQEIAEWIIMEDGYANIL